MTITEDYLIEDESESSFCSGVQDTKRAVHFNIVNSPGFERLGGLSTMSARPRPVTATVNPPLTSTPLHGPRTFLSSDGSTESLISILDHESYESPLPSEDEEPDHESKPEPPQEKEKPRIERPKKRTETAPRSQSAGPRKTCTLAEREQNQLTDWEEWLVRKAKEMRLQEERRRRELEKEKERKRQLEEDKAETDRKRAERARQYAEKKDFKEKLRRNKEKQRQMAKQELEAAAKHELLEKAKVKREEWAKQKAEEERKRKQKEKEEKEKKERLEAEQKAKSEEKVRNWFNEVKKRPMSAPRSYAYSQGKLTGYYDRSAYPEPAFYNPIPWQPIHVPNTVTEKKKVSKKTSKQKFNPHKYL